MAHTQPAEALLQMRDVRMTFGEKAALNHLTFSVRPAEIFGFLGPSGAGKTTTIKLLTRQLRPDSGDITLFGQAIASLNQAIFDQIGVLTDNSGLYERLSVYDNLALFAELKGLPASAIHDALASVGLDGEEKKAAKSLSRGMKQRLMLARATLHNPQLLFLDEPTASLDPGTTQQIHALLRRLNEGGTTIFLTTHNMEEADRLCHRVAFLDHGSIVACDTPDALKLQYANNEIIARTQGGEVYEVEKSKAGLAQLIAALGDDPLLTLHSREPNLEEIFLRLTGRDLS